MERRTEQFCLLSASTRTFDRVEATIGLPVVQPNLHWRRVVRVEQRSGTKGSLKWIRRLVSDHADLLEQPLRSAGVLGGNVSVDWGLSPPIRRLG